VTTAPASEFTRRAASRLKFPQLFAVLLALFLFDLVFPDMVPFIDEILLGLGAALFGTWREPVPTPERPKPPMKNVTPTQPG
jgi:hypothetical protein